MKEIMAFLRPNMISATKKALANGGFPAFTCRPCLGRGKQMGISAELFGDILSAEELPGDRLGETLSERNRLVAKRFFTLIVNDEDVKKAADIIIRANQTGNPGDGKIFVLPIAETYIVRNGERSAEAY
ncbi:MAG: P-II family nitrogen regulator [Oscillospiraceae bacterium]|jgi:nitrogen regulatory protein PII 2|nr:P-II family nitrogen regulator [Oscillospiraceae bacterium]